MKIVLVCLFTWLLSETTWGFVFYPVGNSVLKWNVNSPQMKPSTVNPTTKAIRYYIASDTFSEANRTNEVSAIRAAFDQWASVPGANLRFEFAGFISPVGLDARYDNTNVVFWAKNSLSAGAGSLNLSGRRAVTSPTYAVDGSILDSDIVLNGVQYQWFTDPNDTANQAQFIESIVAHEVGHFLGLDHTPAGAATVIDGGPGINTNSGLSADEVAAVRYLYGDGTGNRSSIRGTVRQNGSGILGAVVVVEDSAGNVAGVNVTQASGAYLIPSLAAGDYKLRVSPLDPSNSGQNSLLRADEIAPDYTFAATGFQPTGNLSFSLAAGENKTQDVNVTAADQPIRITSISKPATLPDLVTVVRFGVSVVQGQKNLYVGVSSPHFQPGATLSISGDGLTVGPTTYHANRVGNGLHSLVVPISVSSNATPGLRTFVVSQNDQLAYANGYLEVASAVPDHNFDALDDRFQRKHWNLWTGAEAAPSADPDNDGLSNRFEFRTDTDPKNAQSFRLVLQQPQQGRFGPQLSWLSDPGKTYQVQRATSLTLANWQPFGAPVIAQGEVWSVPLTISPGGQFYRLELKR